MSRFVSPVDFLDCFRGTSLANESDRNAAGRGHFHQSAGRRLDPERKPIFPPQVFRPKTMPPHPTKQFPLVMTRLPGGARKPLAVLARWALAATLACAMGAAAAAPT